MTQCVFYHHEHGNDHPHEHSHDHPHEHTHEHTHHHSHEHSHDHEHDHSHSHAHGHDHEHSHAHDHGQEDALAESLALLDYMIRHNAAHGKELAGLGQRLRDLGEEQAACALFAAAEDYEKGTCRLEQALKSLKEEVC